MNYRSCHQQLVAEGFEPVYAELSVDLRSVVKNVRPIMTAGVGRHYILVNGIIATMGEDIILDKYYILYAEKLN